MFKYGLIMQNTRVSGEKIKPTGAESSGMPMETSMKASGRTTKQTAMESISMLTVLNMKVIGKMIFKMGRVWKAGKMEADMREDTKKE